MVRALLPLFAVAAALPLGAQDFADIEIQKVAAGFVFTDSPVWSRENFLLFTDVPTNRIIKVANNEKPSAYLENTNGVAGIAFDNKGNLYLCETKTRRVVRIDKKGALEVLADKFEGKRLNAPNDIIVRKDGNAYFTDPAFGSQGDTRELDFYGVYHIPGKGPIELVARQKGRPNGVALSNDGRVLYVTNSDERAVYAYDLDGKGTASNGRVFLSGLDGPPDGLRLDEKGNLFIAGNGLLIYSPQGKLIRKIDLGETPRNLCFGDPDFQTLYISALTSVYRIRLDVKGAVQH